MKNEDKQTVTKNDMHIQQTYTVFSSPIAVISDGKINKGNLRKLKLDETWLVNN